MTNQHIGSSFEDFLKEEGIFEEVQVQAINYAARGLPGSAGRGIAALQSLNCDRIGPRRYNVGDTLSVKGASAVGDRPRHRGALSRHWSLGSVDWP